jgi:hypothetical protein
MQWDTRPAPQRSKNVALQRWKAQQLGADWFHTRGLTFTLPSLASAVRGELAQIADPHSAGMN